MCCRPSFDPPPPPLPLTTPFVRFAFVVLSCLCRYAAVMEPVRPLTTPVGNTLPAVVVFRCRRGPCAWPLSTHHCTALLDSHARCLHRCLGPRGIAELTGFLLWLAWRSKSFGAPATPPAPAPAEARVAIRSLPPRCQGVNPTSPAHLHVRPMERTCRCAGEIKKNTHPEIFTALFREQGAPAPTSGSMPSRFVTCTRPEPFNSTPMGVNPISSGSPHVHPMGYVWRARRNQEKYPPEKCYRSFW